MCLRFIEAGYGSSLLMEIRERKCLQGDHGGVDDRFEETAATTLWLKVNGNDYPG